MLRSFSGRQCTEPTWFLVFQSNCTELLKDVTPTDLKIPIPDFVGFLTRCIQHRNINGTNSNPHLWPNCQWITWVLDFYFSKRIKIVSLTITNSRLFSGLFMQYKLLFSLFFLYIILLMCINTAQIYLQKKCCCRIFRSAVVAYDSELVGKYVQHHNMQA